MVFTAHVPHITMWQKAAFQKIPDGVWLYHTAPCFFGNSTEFLTINGFSPQAMSTLLISCDRMGMNAQLVFSNLLPDTNSTMLNLAIKDVSSVLTLAPTSYTNAVVSSEQKEELKQNEDTPVVVA